MSLSVIILSESCPELKETKINFPETEELQIFFVDTAGSMSIQNQINGRIISIGELNLDEINSEYIMFLDKETVFSKDFFEVIFSEIASKEKYDFFQLREEGTPRINDNINIFEADLDEIISLKIIKKNLLNSFPFFDIKKVNQAMLAELHFELFIRGLTFKTINKVSYKQTSKQSIETIIAEDEIINHLLYSKDPIERGKIKILFKKALTEKLFKLIDNRNFIDFLPFAKQESILTVLRELLLDVDDPLLMRWNLQGYIPFAKMVREGLFMESLYYIRLLRGKRYWLKTTKELEEQIKTFPIEESLSWKITAPLRRSVLWRKKIKSNAVKWGLRILSTLVNLMFIGREVWIISERPDQAEDNGYNFFKYCREKYPNKKIYYLIKKDSPHIAKVKQLGNVIYHSSLKHWIYLLIAKKYISAWVFEETSYPEGKLRFEELFNNAIKKKKQITLQHGVIIHNIAPYLNQKTYNQQLFVASSIAEKEIIKTTLGYEEEKIAVTGLSRFDNLHDLNIKRQILIMPTWRRSLFRLNQSEFLMSEYFNRYYNLVRNPQFLKLIEKEKIEVKFYIHNQMQQFMEEFVYEHPNIQFLTKKDAIVSELLKESALLITDYSSVMADFLYMEKPVLLYQFDPFNNHHGPVKQVSYSEFGEVVTEEDSLVEKMAEAIDRQFKIKEQYLKKSNSFFAFKDCNNSKRIFQAIENLK